METLSNHLTQQEVELFRRRTINEAERRRVDEHIACCEVCLQKVVQPEYAFAALSEAFLPALDEAAFHLSQADLKNFVRGSVDEANKIICESHLEVCDECNRHAQDITAIEAFPITSNEEGLARAARNWRELFWPLRYLTPARLAAIVALFACLLLILAVWQRQRLATPDQVVREGVKESPPTTLTPLSGKDSNDRPQGSDESATAATAFALSLKDNGNDVGLDNRGKLIGLEGFNQSLRQSVEAALATSSLTKPRDLNQLLAPPITLMDRSPQVQSFKLLSPVGMVTADAIPTLRWQPLAGATSYTVSVFDAQFNQIATSAPQSENFWKVTRALPRGVVYSWQVKAVRDGQETTAPVAPAPRAQFKILENEKLQELTLLRNQKPLSHLALGVTYARFGLLSEAEREFQQLVKDNPDSPVAKKLLRTVQGWLQNRESVATG